MARGEHDLELCKVCLTLIAGRGCGVAALSNDLIAPAFAIVADSYPRATSLNHVVRLRLAVRASREQSESKACTGSGGERPARTASRI